MEKCHGGRGEADRLVECPERSVSHAFLKVRVSRLLVREAAQGRSGPDYGRSMA
jgi:hypothetical protein